MKTTQPRTPRFQPNVPLPKLSDESAVELYLFVEHVLLLIESRYARQIRRHFDDRSCPNLVGPPIRRTHDDPPF